MHPHIALIERLSSGTAWDDAILRFWFDVGALGVERFVQGHLAMAKGIAIVAKTRVNWDVTQVVLSNATYKLYCRKGTRLMDEENTIRFIRGLDWLLHDRDFLHESAMHDALTGALNRRGLNEWFEKRRRSGCGNGFVLACVDLDHFKELNDTWGHHQGDEALTELTRGLQSALRSTDVVARIGGDEFVFIIDHTSCHSNSKTRLEEIIREIPLDKYGLTLTMGTACYPNHGTELAQLMAKADVGLYQGKTKGRNTIVLWEECNDSANDF